MMTPVVGSSTDSRCGTGCTASRPSPATRGFHRSMAARTCWSPSCTARREPRLVRMKVNGVRADGHVARHAADLVWVEAWYAEIVSSWTLWHPFAQNQYVEVAPSATIMTAASPTTTASVHTMARGRRTVLERPGQPHEEPGALAALRDEAPWPASPPSSARRPSRPSCPARAFLS